MPPHTAPSPPPPPSHAPACRADTPAACRSQSLPYVLLSQPQTGAYTSGQASAWTLHTPVASAIELQTPSSNSQNCPRGHGRPAMPPQTVPPPPPPPVPVPPPPPCQ